MVLMKILCFKLLITLSCVISIPLTKKVSKKADNNKIDETIRLNRFKHETTEFRTDYEDYLDKFLESYYEKFIETNRNYSSSLIDYDGAGVGDDKKYDYPDDDTNKIGKHDAVEDSMEGMLSDQPVQDDDNNATISELEFRQLMRNRFVSFLLIFFISFRNCETNFAIFKFAQIENTSYKLRASLIGIAENLRQLT